MLTTSSWAKVSPKLGSPFSAQLAVTTIMALLGCIYLGSSTAFNAMMSSAVYSSLSLPPPLFRSPKLTDQNNKQHRLSNPNPN